MNNDYHLHLFFLDSYLMLCERQTSLEETTSHFLLSVSKVYIAVVMVQVVDFDPM